MVNDKGPGGRRAEDIFRPDVNEDEDVSDEEYDAINRQLDQLNGYLDQLEQKNADIHQQLLELLQKSRNTREEFQKMTEPQPTASDSGQSSSPSEGNQMDER